MGYFSNGTEGEAYEAAYCERCIHYGDEDGPGCAVWMAHTLHNYGSVAMHAVLDLLIPRSDDDLSNEQCLMFIEAPPDGA